MFLCIVMCPIAILLLSDFTSLLSTLNVSDKSKSLFYAKYILIFSVIYVAVRQRLLNTDINIEKYLNISIIIFCSLTLFEYWNYFGTFFRASFPGTARFHNTTDSHLLSACTSFLIVSIFEISERKRLRLISIILLFILVLAAGSRTGVVTITVYGILVARRALIQWCYKNWYYLPFIIAGFVYVLMHLQTSFERTLRRLINFDLQNDLSSMNRIDKLLIALSESEDKFFLLGSGPINSENFWYDNTYAMWTSHFGLLFTVIMVTLVVYSVLKSKALPSNLVIIVGLQAALSDYIMASQYFAVLLLVIYWFNSTKRYRTKSRKD